MIFLHEKFKRIADMNVGNELQVLPFFGNYVREKFILYMKWLYDKIFR